MTQSRTVLVVAAAIVVVAVGAFFWFRGPSNTVNAPEGTHWLCRDAACNTEFNLTLAEVTEKYYGQYPPCPKCKKPAARAEKCPSCGKLSPIQRGPAKCPHCGKAMS